MEEVAESWLRQKTLEIFIATGGVGIGYFPATRVSNVQAKERQHLIQMEVWAGVKEVQTCSMVRDSKEHGLEGRMHCKVRSPGPTSGKQTSIASFPFCPH